MAKTGNKDLVGAAKTATASSPSAKKPEAKGKKPLNVIGIGASAGGIEAFGEFIEALPDNTGMAFVLVQHLDPMHESVLDEIFQRKTKVRVEQAAHGMVVLPDHVYIIPPNRNIGIVDGKLVLSPRDEGGGKFMPIDNFFTSLAGTWGNRAVGVVLSGTGYDGTQGLRTIKANGGLTFTQDETSARYPDMPKNAAAAGAADFVLSPERIALELARISKNPLIVAAQSAVGPSEEAVDALLPIYRLLKASSGIDFSNYKASTIRRRISRRMMIIKLEDFDEYEDYLKDNPSELDTLLNDLFINVTSFFRDPEIFDLLLTTILPEILKSKQPDEPVRVWIPGCSTGEEVYSLAMCLVEAAGDKLPNNLIQVFATDISERVIERARSGIYPESISTEITAERLNRFFTKVDNGGYQVSKSIREMCIFARHDLTKDPPFSRMDLISCRNLLIYLAAPQQRKIIPTFHYALNASGVLVLGSSETIGGFGNLFMLVDKQYKIYRKKQAAPFVSYDHFQPVSHEGKHDPAKREIPMETKAFDVYKEADRILLMSYCPASILINEQMDILQFRGSTGNFVEPSSGTASLNLMKMLREELLLEVRALVSQARQQNLAVHKSGVRLTLEGETKRIEIHVVPVGPAVSKSSRFFLIIFKESAVSAVALPVEEHGPGEPLEEVRQVEQLRHELQATREYLQTTIQEKDAMGEEFHAAMEEIQSSNEELQSTNEELETTKEELQSTNEELVTVNEEMQNRNLELSQINDDLNNLLNNVSLPLVMLTADLRIRRYTPTAESILNLIPADLGRPFSDLRMKIPLPDLEEIFLDVLHNLAPREMEVKDARGNWHLLRVRPYTTQEKKIDGVVLTLLDINEMKRTMETLRQAQHFAETVIQTIREPLLVLNAQLQVSVANRAFYNYFQVTPAQTEGNYVYNLGGGQWNLPELRKLLEDILPRDRTFDGLVVEQEFPGLGRKRMVLNARKIATAEAKGEEMILLAMEEKGAEP